MIFVMLGTNPYPFSRLLEAMSKYADESGEKVIAQIGNTPAVGNVECHRYLSHSDVMKLISDADVVVCQGGYGSISDSLSNGAKTVVVPRRVEFSECVDNQIELVEAFARDELVIPVMDITLLPDAISRARVMQIKKISHSSLPDHIAQTIRTMLDEVRR